MLSTARGRSFGLFLFASLAACGGTVGSPVTEQGDAGGDAAARPDVSGSCKVAGEQYPVLTIIDAVTGTPVCGATLVGDAGTNVLSLESDADCTPYTVTGYEGSAPTFSITVTAPGYSATTVNDLGVIHCGCVCITFEPETTVKLSPLVDGGNPPPDASFDGGFDAGTDASLPGCPASPPNGGACGNEGLYCEYGTDPNPNCNDVWQCAGATWTQQELSAGCPSPSGACDPYATLAAGGSCDTQGQLCASPEGTCACTNAPGGQPIENGPVWSCSPAVAGCPEPRAPFGTPCDVSSGSNFCDYGACNGGVAEECDDGYWGPAATACEG